MKFPPIFICSGWVIKFRTHNPQRRKITIWAVKPESKYSNLILISDCFQWAFDLLNIILWSKNIISHGNRFSTSSEICLLVWLGNIETCTLPFVRAWRVHAWNKLIPTKNKILYDNKKIVSNKSLRYVLMYIYFRDKELWLECVEIKLFI